MEKIYPYAVAKIRVKENNLLTKANLDMLASENSIERIVSILRDKGYNFDELQGKYQDYEIVLREAEEDLYKLIKEIVEEKIITEIFVSQNDYYNIKFILKSKIEAKEYKNNLIDGGIIDKAELLNIMENEDYDRLESDVKTAICEAMDLYNKTKMPYTIDAILDRACFSRIKKLAEIVDNKFILGYVQKLIDITNIKTFFRVRRIYQDLSIFEISYIDGGKISLKTYLQNWNEDEQNLQNKFMGFSDIIQKAIYDYQNLDIYCENYIMTYMKEAKLKALTIEPILAYIYAKETEFKNIRIIFTGKLNNVNAEKIKERLRESYV